ncbi:MAG: LysM peptidoglycan-binding domain-containing protein [Bacteroidia bacterium]|nr:LysM peptidoglycan-binding domain-containing protein [Bacteroidia bacterium]
MVSVGAATHPGRVRTTNEDFFYHGPIPQGYVAIVCDGMGGHEAGEVAARLAAESAYQFLCEAPPTEDLKGLVRDAILFANQRLLLHAQTHSQVKGFGSTIVIALLTKDSIVYGHVGDSRLYALVKGEWVPLTQDDTLVNQMVASKIITAEQALHHPHRSVLTQSLGQHPPPTPHVERQPLKRGALYILCTDGLSGALSQEDFLEVLAHPDDSSLQTKAEQLIQKANENGGYDNMTVVLLRAPTKSSTFVANMNLKLPPQKYLIGGGIAIAVLLILVLVFARGRRSSPASEAGEIIIMDDGQISADSSSSTTSSPSEPEPPSNVTEDPIPTGSPTPTLPPSNPPTELPHTASPRPTAPKVSKSETNPSEGKTFDYTIQKGDNLRKIAEIFGTSLAELRQVNGLRDDHIQAGKKLKIPVRAIHSHTVKEKETLSSIARKYGTRIEAIKRANHIEEEKIRVGQKLVVPVVKK